MTIKCRNFEMWQGEHKSIEVALVDHDGEPYGTTSGLLFTWKVAVNESSTTVLITKSTGAGIANGTSMITITLDKADTSSLSPATYYHELRVVDIYSRENVVLTGGLTLRDSITL